MKMVDHNNTKSDESVMWLATLTPRSLGDWGAAPVSVISRGATSVSSWVTGS